MSEKIKTGMAVFLIIIILPYIITYALQGGRILNPEGNILPYDMQKSGENIQKDQELLKKEPTEILTGILAGQISMELPTDAIRAQAVLVRTEYVRREQAGEEQEVSRSLDELTSLWGSQNMRNYYEIAKAAVTDTAGEILTYEGKPILTAYHQVSAGSTRAMDTLNGMDTPYLQAVACDMDITSPDYLTVRFFTFDELRRALGIADKAEVGTITQTADESGYVSVVTVGDNEFSGDVFRRLLDLPSPCFYIKEVEGQIRIVVKGKGHGIGLSQYAAAKQAEEGASYKDILSYFFQNTQLEQYLDS